MADDRRDSRGARRPRGRTGPGRATSGGPGGAPRGVRPGSSERPAPRRPRLTGRAAVLVLVLAVLAVSYASSMRAFLHQRSEIAELKAQIAERRAAIDDLEREKKRWQDPAFVQSRARDIGYVMRGETPFVVLQDGEPLTTGATLSDPDDLPEQAPTAWWVDAWDSVRLAGHPPKDEPPPATTIDGTTEETE
ncbi:FtsB family cell division protein [Nocardioides marmotae]|uniref:Septum formation initiator family protein n=1 Tax=Nocardioides marmotae TaxID=2663857 RepID=A0A6I3J1D7_9ACTN|nr:septum formation initiator family protein [Nocardioides marmotae]MCR6030470.1 septum formation initiator family protein [Gordonia jinghuaiqii]MBC9734602.1 septum formation initiator family protein [Nocardioides marmotae]MTB85703.1 septum formation initiator family protein [Nocardioides marmotae]MTB94106.1 septum formation initiator family protein [Nocardioides marmotae]QKE00405.1 septum formation initiator family protein [Nocardioides marmotae]